MRSMEDATLYARQGVRDAVLVEPRARTRVCENMTP